LAKEFSKLSGEPANIVMNWSRGGS